MHDAHTLHQITEFAALPYPELLALEERLAQQFETLYAQAQEAIAQEGAIAAPLAAALIEAQRRHSAAVEAMQVERLEFETNISAFRPPQ